MTFTCTCGTSFSGGWEGYSFACPDCDREWFTCEDGEVVALDDAPDPRGGTP